MLTKERKDYLLKLARQTLEYYLQTGEMKTVEENTVSEKFRVFRGVFVTLEKNNELRGCIGYIEPIKPIYLAVLENTINAAVNDWRFPPVTKDELKDIKIEISILSEPKLVNCLPRERLKKIRPLVDGVILEKNSQQATYLPQVWEQIKDPNEFLCSLCKKGNWPQDAWQDEKIKLYTYQAEHFKE